MIKGKVTDYGDLWHVEQWLVKGRRLSFRLRVGVPAKASQQDREAISPVAPGLGDGDIEMDLQADKKVTLSLGQWKDEMGNPAPTPADVTVTYTVDNGDIIALTDNGDGTAVAASTGILGTATVHAVASAPGLPTSTGDLALVVVPGDAQRFEIVAGPPEEVTPDV